jgi:type I restriction enzyme S subunit
MDEWRSCTLGDVARVKSGFAFKSQDWSENGIPVVKIANVQHGHLDMSSASFVPEAIAISHPEAFLDDGDILISMTGNVGNVARVKLREGRLVLNQRVGRFLVSDPDVLSAEFLYYFLFAPRTRALMSSLGYGSVQPNVSPTLIHGIDIQIPSLPEQRAISSILSAFDDKIELNRRTAETLEAMARAVFKSWFVDFDPVHAKAAGRVPEWMDAETAALFPDCFGEDGLPEEWIECFGADLFDVTKGRSYKKAELQPSEIALVTLKSFNRKGGYARRGLKPYTGDYNPNQIVLPGEIVMACTDLTQAAEVIGRPAIVEASEFDTLVASLDVLVIRPVPQWLTNEWLYWLLNEPRSHEHMRSYANGSTVLHLSKEAVPTLPCVVPPESVVLAFTALIRPWMERSRHGRNQNAVLENTRDALLPRLLSGELRVDDAEKVAEGVL